MRLYQMPCWSTRHRLRVLPINIATPHSGHAFQLIDCPILLLLCCVKGTPLFRSFLQLLPEATFQWHISYIIYRLYTTYVQYRRHVWYCETCWHHPSVHVWNHQCSSCIEKTLIQTIPLPENNQAIDCHEKKKLPCMPVLLSSARQLTVLQGASYSAVLQGASYRAVL